MCYKLIGVLGGFGWCCRLLWSSEALDRAGRDGCMVATIWLQQGFYQITFTINSVRRIGSHLNKNCKKQ